jgi:hypothetical protein
MMREAGGVRFGFDSAHPCQLQRDLELSAAQDGGLQKWFNLIEGGYEPASCSRTSRERFRQPEQSRSQCDQQEQPCSHGAQSRSRTVDDRIRSSHAREQEDGDCGDDRQKGQFVSEWVAHYSSESNSGAQYTQLGRCGRSYESCTLCVCGITKDQLSVFFWSSA